MRQAILASVVAFAAMVALRAPAADAKSVRLWNPATVATVSGTVAAVEKVEMGSGWSCVRLRLRTAEGTLLVRVGPDWFLAKQRHVFAAGEKLEVKGSRLEFSGEPAMVAGEIVRGTEHILLRDAAGKPTWDGK
jgi:hypothetical protein